MDTSQGTQPNSKKHGSREETDEGKERRKKVCTSASSPDVRRTTERLTLNALQSVQELASFLASNDHALFLQSHLDTAQSTLTSFLLHLHNMSRSSSRDVEPSHHHQHQPHPVTLPPPLSSSSGNTIPQTGLSTSASSIVPPPPPTPLTHTSLLQNEPSLSDHHALLRQHHHLLQQLQTTQQMQMNYLLRHVGGDTSSSHAPSSAVPSPHPNMAAGTNPPRSTVNGTAVQTPSSNTVSSSSSSLSSSSSSSNPSTGSSSIPIISPSLGTAHLPASGTNGSTLTNPASPSSSTPSPSPVPYQPPLTHATVPHVPSGPLGPLVVPPSLRFLGIGGVPPGPGTVGNVNMLAVLPGQLPLAARVPNHTPTPSTFPVYHNYTSPAQLTLADKGTYMFKDNLAQIDWTRTCMRDFDILTELGSGTFGVVRYCRHRGTGVPFCVKILDRSRVTSMKQLEHIQNEKNIMFSVQHPFIVRLFATYKSPGYLFFLMEFVAFGDLFNYIKAEGGFKNDTARLCAAELLLTLQYLHSQGIMYRDLKPENVLIDDAGHLKLIDFGFAKKANHKRSESMCGTPDYMAPEVILNQGHTRGADWWSLGVLIFELIAGYPPFPEVDFRTVHKLYQDLRLTFDSRLFTRPAEDLVRRLLTVDPAQRLGNGPADAEEIKAHPWFAGIDWGVILRCETKGPCHGLKCFKANVGGPPKTDVPFLADEAARTAFRTHDSFEFDAFLAPRINL